MSIDNYKYLVLRGKNKDIYFIQKRLSKNLSKILGKDFIKKSLETKNINIAIKKRDEILAELDLIAKNAANEIDIAINVDETSENEDFNVLTHKNRQFSDVLVKNDAKEPNLKKLINFSWHFWNKKDLIMKIDKFIPIAILLLTLIIAFVA
tara:strand:- start:2389 stop:2841 length:453 start_codon:yes stop_codon:yes gene_type:complete